MFDVLTLRWGTQSRFATGNRYVLTVELEGEKLSLFIALRQCKEFVDSTIAPLAER